MTARPSKFPDFARNDVYDPTSGQLNVVEPSEGKKDAGWAYNEKPPRQYFNWMHRLTSQWLRYLDEQNTESIEIPCLLQGFTADKAITLTYIRKGNMGFLHIPTTFDASTTTNLRITTVTGVFPFTPLSAVYIPCTVLDNEEHAVGTIFIGDNTQLPFEISEPCTAGQRPKLDQQYFTASGNKGVYGITLAFAVR
jgi:hypothetical protein